MPCSIRRSACCHSAPLNPVASRSESAIWADCNEMVTDCSLHSVITCCRASQRDPSEVTESASASGGNALGRSLAGAGICHGAAGLARPEQGNGRMTRSRRQYRGQLTSVSPSVPGRFNVSRYERLRGPGLRPGPGQDIAGVLPNSSHPERRATGLSRKGSGLKPGPM